jgi:hypothetical protein
MGRRWRCGARSPPAAPLPPRLAPAAGWSPQRQRRSGRGPPGGCPDAGGGTPLSAATSSPTRSSAAAKDASGASAILTSILPREVRWRPCGMRRSASGTQASAPLRPWLLARSGPRRRAAGLTPPHRVRWEEGERGCFHDSSRTPRRPEPVASPTLGAERHAGGLAPACTEGVLCRCPNRCQGSGRRARALPRSSCQPERTGEDVGGRRRSVCLGPTHHRTGQQGVANLSLSETAIRAKV